MKPAITSHSLTYWVADIDPVQELREQGDEDGSVEGQRRGD